MDTLTQSHRIFNGVPGAIALTVPKGEQGVTLLRDELVAAYGRAFEVCLVVRPEDLQLDAVRAGEVLCDGIDALGPSRDDHVREREYSHVVCDVERGDCPAANDSEFHNSVVWWFDLLITLQISVKILIFQRKKREKSSKTKIKIGKSQNNTKKSHFTAPLERKTPFLEHKNPFLEHKNAFNANITLFYAHHIT
jgi:hypothetical protein